MSILPESFQVCLLLFHDHFTARSCLRFLVIMRGWLFCTGKRTVTGVLRVAGVAGERDHTGYHRFFSRGAWESDEISVAMMSLVLTLVPRNERVTLTIDDMLARHTGRYISSAGMHRDPLLSCATRPFVTVQPPRKSM